MQDRRSCGPDQDFLTFVVNGIYEIFSLFIGRGYILYSIITTFLFIKALLRETLFYQLGIWCLLCGRGCIYGFI